MVALTKFPRSSKEFFFCIHYITVKLHNIIIMLSLNFGSSEEEEGVRLWYNLCSKINIYMAQN